MEKSELEWGRILAHFLDGKSFKFMKKAKAEGIVDLRDKLEALWWELIGLALQCNNHGALWNEEVSCGKTGEIAALTDRTEGEVKICLDWYSSNKMAKMTVNGLIIENFDKYQFTDKLELIREKNRLRQRKFRDSKRMIDAPSDDSNVTVTVTSRSKNKEYKNIRLDNKETTPKVVVDKYDKYDKPAFADRLCPLTKQLIRKKFLDYADLQLFEVDEYLVKKSKEMRDSTPKLYAVINYVISRYDEKTVEDKKAWFIASVENNLSNLNGIDDWEKKISEMEEGK